MSLKMFPKLKLKIGNQKRFNKIIVFILKELIYGKKIDFRNKKNAGNDGG